MGYDENDEYVTQPEQLLEDAERALEAHDKVCDPVIEELQTRPQRNQ
ncbi:hypothetical protein [Candidatus Liberibacter sp.]|nr:hypothetical protein [Candidatus Liberibacter sp.]MBA5724498.1 hypothetical protein [Candidatus Liberibacter sp.]